MPKSLARHPWLRASRHYPEGRKAKRPFVLLEMGFVKQTEETEQHFIRMSFLNPLKGTFGKPLRRSFAESIDPHPLRFACHFSMFGQAFDLHP